MLVLSYSRSGSSLLGHLLSVSASSYYFEPLWQHQLDCPTRRNNSEKVSLMEEVIGGVFDCDPSQINNLHMSVVV